MEEAMTAVLINELGMQVCHIGVKKGAERLRYKLKCPLMALCNASCVGINTLCIITVCHWSLVIITGQKTAGCRPPAGISGKQRH